MSEPLEDRSRHMLLSEPLYSSCQTYWHHISMCDYHQEYTGCLVSHHMHQNVVKVVGAVSGADDDGNQESASFVDRNTYRDGEDDDDCSYRPNLTLTANNFIQRLPCGEPMGWLCDKSGWIRTRNVVYRSR